MAIEQSPDKNLPSHETDPMEDLLWRSADIIAAHGNRRDLKNHSFIEAEWDDDEENQQYNLRSVTTEYEQGNFTTEYTLTTYPLFSMEPDGFFRYTTDDDVIEACNKDWSVIPASYGVDYTHLIAMYLKSAHVPNFQTTHEQQALEAIIYLPAYDKSPQVDTTVVNRIRQQLLEKLLHHLNAFDDLLGGDEALICTRLTGLINNDFEKMEGLSQNDEMISNGEMVFILKDTANDISNPAPVLPGYTLRGRFSGFTITEMPVIKNTHDLLHKYDDDHPPDVRPFGLAMVLKDIGMYHEMSKDEERYPSDEQYNFCALIPFDVQEVPMGRVVVKDGM